MSDRKTADDLVLDALPPGWEWARLGALCAHEPNAMTDGPFGSKLKSNDYTSEGVRVIRLGNVGVGALKLEDESFISSRKYKELRKHEVFEGDLVIAALADPVGRCAPVPAGLGKAVVKADCVRFKPGPAVRQRYLMHALNSPQGRSRAEELSHGLGRLRINMRNMRELPIPLPPLDEQRRIVGKVDALQAHGAKARTALDAIPPLLERFRLSVLAAAFRGDLTAEWRAQNPNVEPVAELLDRTPIPPRPKRMKSRTIAVIPGDAGLSVGNPELPRPRGWKWVPLIDIARMESGHTPSRRRPEWWGGDVPWIGLRDAGLHHGETITETRECTNEDGLANSAARLLPAGTVCLSRTGTIGYTTVMGRPMATSQDFVNWVCTDATHPSFLKYLFMAEKQARLRFSRQTTNIATIYYPELLAFHISLPPIEEQREIARLVEARLEAMEAMQRAFEQAVELLPNLERSVLAKAFRGELVPQDPDDEPAAVLLERIRAAAEPKKKRRRKRKAAR